MQIIAGIHKGRKLFTPTDKGVRPTASKMREAVFNILTNMNAIEDAKVVDLCCGTGALGIEAISRGAKLVVFIDGSNQHLQLARANIEQIKENDKAIFLRANAENLPKANQKFDLIFLDPPYHKKIADRTN